MKYSVLISVYKKDSAEFLKPALESIYEKQTKKPDEIVIVFDGPITEELHRVLDDFKKDKQDICKYLPQNENRGLGDALRIGAENCTGDYIFRMDSDDISLPTRFEKQAKFLEENPQIDVLGTDISEFYYSTDEVMRKRICPSSHNELVKMSKKRNPMNHMTVCIKRSALEKSGGYKKLILMEDYYLWVRMIAEGCKFANINESLVYARIGNGFNTKRGSKLQIESRKTIQKFMVENKMTNLPTAVLNIIGFSAAVYCPNFLRKFLYDKLLRKQKV